MTEKMATEPVVADGLEYWKTQPATYDGVLGACVALLAAISLTCGPGGFGTGVTAPYLCLKTAH